MKNEQTSSSRDAEAEARALELHRQRTQVSDNPWAAFHEYIDMIDDAQRFREEHIGDIEYIEQMMEPVYKRKG